MKKSILFSILFFMATAVILLYSTSCEKDDAPLTTKIVYLGSPQAIDAEGNATLEFNGYCSNPDVSKIVYSVKAVAGSSSDKPTGTVVTNDDDDDDDDVTTKAGSTLRVISRGTGCTVLFHTDNPETFPGATIIVTATQVVFKDGRVGLFLAQSASTTATASVLPMEINPDDPEDPDNPDDPEEEDFLAYLAIAEELEENSFVINETIYNVVENNDYADYHTYVEDGGSTTYTIHCCSSSYNNSVYAGIDISEDFIGEVVDMLTMTVKTKSSLDLSPKMYFEFYSDPTIPYNETTNPQISYNSSEDISDVEISVAVAKCWKDSNSHFHYLGYMKTVDGDEAYCHLNCYNGDIT